MIASSQPRAPRELQAAELAGELRGYRAGPPPDRGLHLADIDVEVCAESRCDVCGHAGLECRQYHRNGSYRAFSRCPGCGAEEEI